MELVTLQFIAGVYGLIHEEIVSVDNNFFRGFFFLCLWIFIISLIVAFIASFFYNWKIGVGIIALLIIIEIITAIGKAMGG